MEMNETVSCIGDST